MWIAENHLVNTAELNLEQQITVLANVICNFPIIFRNLKCEIKPFFMKKTYNRLKGKIHSPGESCISSSVVQPSSNFFFFSSFLLSFFLLSNFISLEHMKTNDKPKIHIETSNNWAVKGSGWWREEGLELLRVSTKHLSSKVNLYNAVSRHNFHYRNFRFINENKLIFLYS